MISKSLGRRLFTYWHLNQAKKMNNILDGWKHSILGHRKKSTNRPIFRLCPAESHGDVVFASLENRGLDGSLVCQAPIDHENFQAGRWRRTNLSHLHPRRTKKSPWTAMRNEKKQHEKEYNYTKRDKQTPWLIFVDFLWKSNHPIIFLRWRSLRFWRCCAWLLSWNGLPLPP